MMVRFARVLFASACALAAAGCETTGGEGYHTFAGIRSEVADHIAGFIRRNSRPGR